MSPPQQLTGHAARAVISTERRVQIWDQFYISFKETIPPYQWCTRQELVEAACSGKTGIKFTVEELTEVIRGRKHKRESGVDSQKVDGEWLYRFIPPAGAGNAPAPKAPASKLPAGSPTAKRPAASSAPKAKAKTSKTTPKRNGPLRPRAKSPTATPPPAAPASRKRGTPSETPVMTTRLRSSAKKARPSPRPRGGGDGQVVKSNGGGAAGMVGGMFKFGRTGVEDGGEGTGWSCAVM